MMSFSQHEGFDLNIRFPCNMSGFLLCSKRDRHDINFVASYSKNRRYNVFRLVDFSN